MRAPWLLAILLAACAAEPADEFGEELDGKADGPVTGVPTKRRQMTYVTCPPGDTDIKVAFFDADSTLRVSKSGTVTADHDRDVNVLPFAAREIARLRRAGYRIAVVSNQGGVGSGHQDFATAQGALAFMVQQLGRLGGKVHYFDFAENYDNFRKPNTGMATQLDSQLQTKCGNRIDLTKSFMVGDSGYKKNVDGPHPDGRPADDFSNSDRLFAENLGVPFHEPTDYFGWRDYDVYNIASEAELTTLLDKIEAHAAELREMGAPDEEVAALEAEAQRNREVNGL